MFSVKYKNKSSKDIALIWKNLIEAKGNIESRLGSKYVVDIDPINERFSLIPIEESFKFSKNISCKIRL